MGRVAKVVNHLNIDEVKEIIKKQNKAWLIRRWLVIYNVLVNPRPAKEIGKVVGLSESTVQKLIIKYNKFGPRALAPNNSSKRSRAYMTKDEESKFLAEIKNKISKNEVFDVNYIRKRMEKRLERKVHPSTVYRFLKRNGWHKKPGF